MLLTEGFPDHYETIGPAQGGQLGGLEWKIYEECIKNVLLFYQYLIGVSHVGYIRPEPWLVMTWIRNTFQFLSKAWYLVCQEFHLSACVQHAGCVTGW